MACYQWNKNLLLVFFIAMCPSLATMEPEEIPNPADIDPVLLQSTMLLMGYNNYMGKKQYDKAYNMATAAIEQHKNNPSVLEWHRNRLSLALNHFPSDDSKVDNTTQDCLAIVTATSKQTSVNAVAHALNYLKSQVIAGNEKILIELEKCILASKENPLVRFIACNHCITLALQGIPLAKQNTNQYFQVYCHLATTALPLLGYLDNSSQQLLIGSFVNNATTYLERKMILIPKTSPEDNEMIAYRDLIISFFKQNSDEINFNHNEDNFLENLYEHSLNKPAICKFLFPLVEFILARSQWDHKKGPLRNKTHSFLVQLTGFSYFHGAGVIRDYKKAASHLDRALKKGTKYKVFADTIYALSYMQMNGHGCPKNLAAAEEGLKNLIPLKNKCAAQALYQLGMLKFEQLSYGSASNYFTDAKNLIKSLLNADPDDQYEKPMLKFLLASTVHGLATNAYEAKDYKAAVSNFTELATIGCSDMRVLSCMEFAYLLLGDLHAKGLGTAPSAENALKWYKRVTQSSDHEDQRFALIKILNNLGDPNYQPDENVRRMVRWNKYTIGAVPLPAGWPALTATGTIDYETALVRLAELNLHRQPATEQSLNSAQEDFTRATNLFYDILHRENETPEQAAEVEPHRAKLQQLYAAALVGLGETSYQQQRYDDAGKYFLCAAVTKNQRPDLQGYAKLRLGDLNKNKLVPPSIEKAIAYYTKAAQQTDHLPSKKAAEERLKEFASK